MMRSFKAWISNTVACEGPLKSSFEKMEAPSWLTATEQTSVDVSICKMHDIIKLDTIIIVCKYTLFFSLSHEKRDRKWRSCSERFSLQSIFHIPNHENKKDTKKFFLSSWQILCFTVWNIKTTVWDTYFTVRDTNPALWNREYTRRLQRINKTINIYPKKQSLFS